MSNNPILPIVPDGEEPVDEGETTDNQATVDKDVREADAVNKKLDE
jgi:hypothetical protein